MNQEEFLKFSKSILCPQIRQIGTAEQHFLRRLQLLLGAGMQMTGIVNSASTSASSN